MERSPQFMGRPVVVIHLGTDDSEEGRWLAACSGDRFEPVNSNEYRHIPKVPCTGCLNAAKKGL